MVQMEQIGIGQSGNTTINVSSISSFAKEEYVPICQMAQYETFTLMGTIYGEILAVKS
jgi:hypothetical protein